MSGDIDVVNVIVESEFFSKISWTQVVAFACSGLFLWTSGKINIEPETQAYIVFVIQGIAGLLTIFLRRHSNTITPTAAEGLRSQSE